MGWLERVRERLGAMGVRWIGIAHSALVAWAEFPLPQAAFYRLTLRPFEVLGRDG